MRNLTVILFVFCSFYTWAYDIDRGFRHPGGLHTQSDFDRVKTQLAAGNEKVTAAYNILKTAAYAQPTVSTSPVETIVRGGSSGENYINAARGATMAYQNALRWKIEDNEACAKAAVRILMAWANTTKNISGDSNYALASGLYGYQFAQAAELMRDYEGWSRADFEKFKTWMLDVWYPKAIGFLRNRNGTWENSGKWWQAPGHYWSNWGLCNTLCVALIGILCDDVFIYNQAMSYFKYDQVGTFTAVRTDNPIKNDGLTEFLGNLVVTTQESDLETGSYGMLGQMNESGRDTGHSAMALGLAIDLAKVGWNQGDDLFAYMDHRLAAGIEYVAAQTQNVEGLPWTDYAYGTNGYYYTDSRVWVMTGPALGAQMRPYWGTVIGIYEGVKGVQMPFSDASYDAMGIDAGGQGNTSGGYDHLGYSVLMNTRDEQLAPSDKVPTELSPMMEYSGSLTSLIPSLSVEQALGNVSAKTIRHSELGGLINTFQTNNNVCLPKGQTVKLMPQLPEGEEDTGLWQWETGETTRNITVTTDKSYIYRVTYTNRNGIKSEQMFSLAVQGDCTPAPALTGTITYNGETITTDSIEIFCGEKVQLSVTAAAGYGTFRWNTGQTSQTITTAAITDDTDYTVTFTNQGGATTEKVFHIKVKYFRPDITVNGVTTENATNMVVNVGDDVVIGPYVPNAVSNATFFWGNEVFTRTQTFNNIQTSQIIPIECSVNDTTFWFDYSILVKDNDNPSQIDDGIYLIQLKRNLSFLMLPDNSSKTEFVDADNIEIIDYATPPDNILWYIYDANGKSCYNIQSLSDGSYLRSTLYTSTTEPSGMFYLHNAIGTSMFALQSRSKFYLLINDNMSVNYNTEKILTEFPFELTFVRKSTNSINGVLGSPVIETQYFTLSGIRISKLVQGLNIIREKHSDGSVVVKKINIKR